MQRSKKETAFRKKHKIPDIFDLGMFFEKGTKLAPHYIVIRSGYTSGKYSWRAVGYNAKTREKEYAT